MLKTLQKSEVALIETVSVNCGVLLLCCDTVLMIDTVVVHDGNKTSQS